MKVLFIGGTGLISSACSELALRRGIELTLLNRSRSTNYPVPPGARVLSGDVRAGEAGLAAQLEKEQFDAVVDWIAFKPADIERDLRLFEGKTGQFIFISSASAYLKPPVHYLHTEESPLGNPFWQYSRDKITCEQMLMDAYHWRGFPATIIRPSLTYGPSQIPLINASWQHPWTAVQRMLDGRPIIVPGDGTSLWPLTWNGDFAKGLVGLLGQKPAVGEAFHITTDEILTWNQIFEQVANALGIEANLVHIASDLIVAHDPESLGTLTGDKIHSSVFDNSKIKRFVPDFRCEVTWAEGVRRCLEWFSADPLRRSIDEQMNATWDRILDAYRRAYPA
jgi:nucleoside-diphosphate-sugar epimerase